MEKAKATPKDFFLWAGAMLSLWGGVVAFIALIFDYLNYVFPDALSYYYMDPFSSGIAYEMASLIVLAPTSLILMRLIRRDIARDVTRNDIWVRRWALFLTLFVAGATIVIDLIVLLTTFLQGEELTIRFLLKVLVVLLVTAAGFMHFTADLWGFWVKYPSRARWVSWATAALVLISIIAGFFIVGTPADARKARLDQQRVSDLQSIQSQVVYFYQQKNRLPQTLSELNDPLSYFTVPMDPETAAAYGYSVAGAPDANPAFEVCATFTAESRNSSSSYVKPVGRGGMDENWEHGAGMTCFARTIDPELYPQTPKPVR